MAQHRRIYSPKYAPGLGRYQFNVDSQGLSALKNAVHPVHHGGHTEAIVFCFQWLTRKFDQHLGELSATINPLKILSFHDTSLSGSPNNSPKDDMAHIEKRGEKWRVQIRMRGAKPISKTFSKKVLAERWAREMELEIETRALAPVDPDLGELAQRYLDEVLPLKPCGRTKRETIKFLSKRLAGVPLSKLTPAWMLQYAKERNVAPATLVQDVIFLGLVLEAAEVLWEMKVDLDGFRRGRAALAKHGLTGKAVERDRRVTDHELEQVVARAPTDLPLRDLIDFALATAMRISEQMNLRWEDLDREGRTILIRDRKHPRLKVGNNQRVPLLGKAWDIILRQPLDGPLIFPFNHKSVATAFHRGVLRAEIDDLRWHDLRHEAISRLFETGKYGIPEVALVSGHRSWEQLRRYTAISAASLHK